MSKDYRNSDKFSAVVESLIPLASDTLHSAVAVKADVLGPIWA